MMNFSAQLQDIGVSLVGGQSPFTVIAQQVPQLASAVAASNATLGQFISTAVLGAGRILAAWAPVIAGVAAVGAATAGIMAAAAREREQRITATSGRGRGLGASGEDLEQAARRSQQPGMTLAESRTGIQTGAREGIESLSVIEKLNAASKQYAATINSDLAPAQQKLMATFADLSKNIDTLDSELGLKLPQSTKDYIRSLEAVGAKGAAAQVAIDAMSKSLASQSDSSTAAGRAWAFFWDKVEKGAEVAGRTAQAIPKALTAPTPLDPSQAGQAGVSGQMRSAEAARAATASYNEQKAAAESLAQAEKTMKEATEQSARAFENQQAVMMATTVEQRAAATQTQVLDELTKGQAATLQQAAQAMQAGNMVRAEATAQQTQAIFAQQQELAMGQQLIAAAGLRGAAGVQLQAQLQQELALRQQGIDVTTRDSQARIANAGAIAQQNLAMQDAAQAAQLGTQVAGQIRAYEAQAAAIGTTSAEKAKLLSLSQSEIQALAAEAQGMNATAAAIRGYAEALAEAAASAARAQEIQQNKELAVSLQGTLDAKRLEIDLVGASAGRHAEETVALQYENQARAAEAQGLTESAAMYRDRTRSRQRRKTPTRWRRRRKSAASSSTNKSPN
jgi:hypothetical protein